MAKEQNLLDKFVKLKRETDQEWTIGIKGEKAERENWVTDSVLDELSFCFFYYQKKKLFHLVSP